MEAIKPKEGKAFVKKTEYALEENKVISCYENGDPIYYRAQRHYILYLAKSEQIEKDYIEIDE